MIKKIVFVLAVSFSAMLGSISVQAAETNQIAIKQEVVPVYPSSALAHKHTGWAVVKYSVNKKGRATNVVVTDSEPANVFDRAARKAILKTKFEIPMVNGEPGSVSNQLKKFVFEIDEEIPGDVAARRR